MRLGSALLIATVAALVACDAHTQGSIESRLTATIARMASKDLATREAALSELGAEVSEEQRGGDNTFSAVLARFSALHAQQADQVKMGLINLLQADNYDFMNPKTAPGTYTEDDMEHYAQTIQIVSGIHDERSIPALVGAISTGTVATDGLLQFGDKALGPVLMVLTNPDGVARASAIRVAVAILKAKNAAAARAQVMAVIRTGIADPNPAVRYTAVDTIENLTREKQFRPELQEFVAILQNVAKHDPDISSSGVYGMRNVAQKALDRIASDGDR